MVSQRMASQRAHATPSRGTSSVPRRLRAASALASSIADTSTRLDGIDLAVVNWRDPWQSVAGGAEEYAWQISRQLAARGANVSFVTSRAKGQRRHERRDGIALYRMGAKFTVYLRAMLWFALRRWRFDVVIDCMNGIPFFCPLVVPRSTPVICVVHHVHDRQFFVHFPPLLAWFGRFLEGPVARWVYRHQVVASVSPSTVAAMRERLRWRGPVHVVPNGCPSVRPIMASSIPAEGDPAIVCVGRLVAHKRVERVIDLAAELRKDWPRLRVHVIGRGPHLDVLHDYVAARGLDPWVRLYGFLPPAVKNSLVATAMLHVSASEFEGWGLSVIEAAALGVPTVAYAVDGLRDAIRDGHTGWLARNGERLAQTVDRALRELRDPDRRAEVQRACQHWSGLFTWASSGERMAQLVARELALEPRSRRRRTGGPAYVMRYRHGGRRIDGNSYGDGDAAVSMLVAAEDRDRVAAAIARRGDELTEVRAATAVELLFGHPEIAETP